MEDKILELTKREYALRQFIVVEKDEVIQAKRRLLEEEKRENNETESKKKRNIALINLIDKYYPIGPAITLTLVTTEVVLKLIDRQKEMAKKLNINYISFIETCKLIFPVGHPRENEVYVAHPTLDNVYFPVNEFHKKLFEDKFRELNLLLMSLGASKVEVEYVSGWGVELTNQEDISVAKAEIGVKKNKTRKVIFSANYEGNNSKQLPERLSWYHFEPTWQNIGNGRLNHGLKNFNLLLEYKDDFGINADLFAFIKKNGYGSKNNFTKREETVWKIVGEFN